MTKENTEANSIIEGLATAFYDTAQVPTEGARSPESQTSKQTNASFPIDHSGNLIRWSVVSCLLKRYGLSVLIVGGLTTVGVVKFPPNIIISQLSAQQQTVSLAEYERLRIGMTLTDAQATLGRAIEVSLNETTATYKWANGDGSEITATFQGDRLMSKQQSGLR